MKTDEKKKNSSQDSKSEIIISLGLLFGIILGGILEFITEEIMWISIGPAIGLMIGMFVESTGYDKKRKKKAK